MRFNFLDLFSGIGGFALGAQTAGLEFENHFFSDIEGEANKRYHLRFPKAIPLGGIKEINPHSLKKLHGDNWIITGGFPCQDISQAGKREGLFNEYGEETRSGLWFGMWRLVRDLRPRFVIAENVPALNGFFPARERDSRNEPTIAQNLRDGEWAIESEEHQALEAVLTSLAKIRYHAEWQIISAKEMGAPHERKRIWIVAYPYEEWE